MSDSYHHGNLRQALIDAGLKIINEDGVANLSLRKTAALCRVSHAAPYAHFKDKDELIEAIKSNITEGFTKELETAVKASDNAESAIVLMGRAYVSFFVRNPDYFRFLFGTQNIVAHIRPGEEHKEDYPPFVMFRNTYLKYLKEQKLKKSRDEQEIEILKLWASAHGLAAIACMSGVEVSFEWEDKLSGDILLK